MIKTYTGHRGVRYGCALVVMPAGSGDDSPGDQGEGDERQPKRRKINPSTTTDLTSEPAPVSPTAPPAPSETHDSAWIITGTDTEDIILYDLQTRQILQRIHSRTFLLPETERKNRQELRGTTTTTTTTSAEDDQRGGTDKPSEGVVVDEREEEACLALGAHPFRRELAVGGLGGECVVRIWRDGV